jgi:hypothetical protein
MPDINILEPIDQQFLTIDAPLWWAEITMPGTLTKAYKDTGHAFDFSIATMNGAPVFITGEIKILGGGHIFTPYYDYDGFDDNNVWHDRTTGFTTPSDWTTKSINIYFKLYAPKFFPCEVSLREFKIRVFKPTRPQYLPLMGVG